MNNVYLCEWQSAVLVLYILQSYWAGCVLSVCPWCVFHVCWKDKHSCTLMTLKCFWDSECMCMRVLVCVRLCAPVCVCTVFLTTSVNSPVGATFALYNYHSLLPPEHTTNASPCVCVCAWVRSLGSHEALSGISEQLCLSWNSLSAPSTLTGDLFTCPSPLYCTHIYINSQHTHKHTCRLQGVPRTRWDRLWASNDPENRAAAEW